jgi:CRP-like cAMP-binding protein
MRNSFLLQRQLHRAAACHRLGLSETLYDRYTQLAMPDVVEVRFKRGEPMQMSGQRERYFYWLASGVARRGYFSIVGEDVTLGFVADSENTASHSELLAAQAGLEAKEFYVAETAVHAFRLDWQAIMAQRANHSFVDDYYLHAIEWGIRRYAANLHIRSIPAASERLAAFRLAYPGLEQRITQRALASFLGITSQYMSKLLRSASMPA